MRTNPKNHPDCVFCQIILGKIPAYKIYEDDLSLAFLSIDPLSPGHSLVIPKQHYKYIWDVQDEELYTHLFKVAKKVALKLKQAYQPKIVIQAIEGLEVPHAHIHLIPSDTPIEPLFKKHQTSPPDYQQLQEEAKKITKTS